jgi:hypothetical protein
MNGNDQASDYDMLRAVSNSLSRVPLARPPQLELEAVMARGRARQRRRRTSGMTAALAVVAAGAATATTLLAGSHPASPAASARLAAWTVARRADGDIHVTIRELSDPAGLQSTLRADGVPASVTFLGQSNPACSPLGIDPGLLGKIFPVTPSGVRHQLPGGVNVGTGGPQDMVIDPSAIPSGVGLQLAWLRIDGSTVGHTALVHASQQCTGS